MNQHTNKTVILIAGPTAVGKTAVAVAVAKHFNTEIISADSRQCFKELSIGVARPSPEELAAVPHHFIATHSVHQPVTAATFEAYALEKADEIFRRHNVLVMTGGTGLYINAFTDGMDLIPEIPEDVHNSVVAAYKERGLSWLQEEVKLQDPLFWEKGEVQNPQRMMRALEVVRFTGQSIYTFRRGEKKKRDFVVNKIALELPKEQLHQNIHSRVDKMLEAGLVEEVKALFPFQHVNALQTVGYREIFSYLKNEVTLESAVDAIKQNTRRYAKRQLTWFRKDKDYQWLNPDPDIVIRHLRK